MVASGNRVPLNLGPLWSGGGLRVGLNLGVDWSQVDPPAPTAEALRIGVRIAWQGTQRLGRLSTTRWRQAAYTRSGAELGWVQNQVRFGTSTAMPWSIAGTAAGGGRLAWLQCVPQQRAGRRIGWVGQGRERSGLALRWESAALLGAQWLLPYGALPAVAREAGFSWAWPGLTRQAQALRWQLPGRWAGKRDLPWGLARPLPWIVRPPVKPPEPEPEPPQLPGSRVGLNLSCLPLRARGLAPLNLGVAACYVVRPQQRTYVVINEISVVRLPDRTPIHMSGVTITSSCDAWGSTFDFELADAGQLPLLKPSAAGPRQVEVTLNGYTWTALVESYSARREWASSGINLTGRSRTALLAAPYAPGRVKVSTEDRSVAQLVDEELADTGFTASYDTVDWVVPAGAWFYDATTALDAISRLAEASGGVVQSDPAALALKVRARYPESPWHWRERTPDHVVQEDIVSNESLQMRSAPLYDAVVVTGELAGKGVTCKVRRAGEAGQLFAPQVSSPLVNTSAAGTERGRNILSDRGEQALVDLVIPLFAGPLRPGEVGRVKPLDLVEVVGEEGIWHGLCVASRTEARTNDKAVVIEQTITLERHYTDAD